MPKPKEHIGSIGRRYQQKRVISAQIGGQMPLSVREKLIRGVLKISNKGAPIKIRAKDRQGREFKATIRK